MIHPLLSFLKNAPNCPPFNILEKYFMGVLSPVESSYINEHMLSCILCQNLQSPFSIDDDEIDKKQINKINTTIKNTLIDEKSPPTFFSQVDHFLKIKHDVLPFQIWSTKNKIHTIFAEEIRTYYPYFVFVKTRPQRVVDKYSIIRVQPISFITEFASEGDIYFDETNSLDRPFIIETWNEQPMLEANLDFFIGEIKKTNIDTNLIQKNTESSSKIISQFRYLEIENTHYLRRPVLALIEYYETIGQEIEYPILNFKGKYTIINEYFSPETSQDIAIAARLGITKEDKGLVKVEAEIDNIKYRLFIRGDGKISHIMLTSTNSKLEIYDNKFDSLIPTGTHKIEKYDYLIYENLSSGIYYISSEDLISQDWAILKISEFK